MLCYVLLTVSKLFLTDTDLSVPIVLWMCVAIIFILLSFWV